MTALARISEIPRPTLIGFLTPLFALGGIALSIGISPTFDWVSNALSDLGHYTRTDIGPNPLVRAIIFNSGLIITGVLFFVITIVFIRNLSDLPTQFAMLPFLVASVFLTSIGILSENFGEIHFYVSVGLFASFPFAMWFIGLSWLRFPKLRWFSAISLLLPFFSVYIWWGTFNDAVPWTGMAIPEILTAFTAIFWVWTLLYLEVKGHLNHLLGAAD
ncbi:MAG: DUF998 domain-containing protein [Promethearchaeota archaeon]